MTESEVRIAKRLVNEMLRVSRIKIVGGKIQHEQMLYFFQGIGLTLAFVYEECTGKQAGNLKPKELMQWAIDLPNPERIRKV